MGNGCVNAASLRPPFGSPERGAVAARSGVTEGLVQRWCGKTTLPVNRLRAGVEARPYDVWEGGCDKPEYPVDRRRRTGDGAPYDVWEGVSVKPKLSVIQRKGRRGRRPLRWSQDAGISGAVRSSGSLGAVFHTRYVV